MVFITGEVGIGKVPLFDTELGSAPTVNPDPTTIHSPIVPAIAARVTQLAPEPDTTMSPDRTMGIFESFRFTGDGPASSPTATRIYWPV